VHPKCHDFSYDRLPLQFGVMNDPRQRTRIGIGIRTAILEPRRNRDATPRPAFRFARAPGDRRRGSMKNEHEKMKK
jgi:hypothetical protein